MNRLVGIPVEQVLLLLVQILEIVRNDYGFKSGQLSFVNRPFVQIVPHKDELEGNVVFDQCNYRIFADSLSITAAQVAVKQPDFRHRFVAVEQLPVVTDEVIRKKEFRRIRIIEPWIGPLPDRNQEDGAVCISLGDPGSGQSFGAGILNIEPLVGAVLGRATTGAAMNLSALGRA